MVALLFLGVVGLNQLSFGFSQASGQQDQTSDTPLLSMPQEYLNYTIKDVNGTLYAIIDGLYPMHMSTVIEALPMVYPTPPGTVNMHIKLDGQELTWINYSDIDPTVLHYTDIGDWQMVYCVVNPSSQDFVLQIHYEHPIQIINRSYIFLYDLNISPYLSPSTPISTAHFRVQLPTNTTGPNIFTTGFEGKWTSREFNSTKTSREEIVTFDLVSKYAEPLSGDIAFVLQGYAVPELSGLTVMVCISLVSFVVLLLYVKNVQSKNPNGA